MTDKQYTDADRAAALQETTDAIKAYVEWVEGKPATTRNHYAEYMTLFGAMCDDFTQRRDLAGALIRLGANRQGVIDGFKATTGENL